MIIHSQGLLLKPWGHITIATLDQSKTHWVFDLVSTSLRVNCDNLKSQWGWNKKLNFSLFQWLFASSCNNQWASITLCHHLLGGNLSPNKRGPTPTNCGHSQTDCDYMKTFANLVYKWRQTATSLSVWVICMSHISLQQGPTSSCLCKSKLAERLCQFAFKSASATSLFLEEFQNFFSNWRHSSWILNASNSYKFLLYVNFCVNVEQQICRYITVNTVLLQIACKSKVI